MLRIGIHELSEADSTSMQQIFDSVYQAPHGWAHVSRPPYDLLVVKNSASVLQSPYSKIIAKKYLIISDTLDTADTASIAKPFSQEKVQNWLNSHINFDTPSEFKRVNQIPDKLLGRIKLLKWPPQEILNGDKNKFKIATMISRRAMTVEEIAQSAHQPVQECQNFINVLHQRSLIEILKPEERIENITQINLGSPPVTLSFLQRIRQKLGI